MKSIQFEEKDVIEVPLWYHKRGLCQTASGYGQKLVTHWNVRWNKKLYRVYCCIFSNSGTNYIISKGETITVNWGY